MVALGGLASLLVFVGIFARRWTRNGAFGAANAITLGRLLLLVGLSLSVDAGPAWAIGVLLLLLLDGVDGWVARRCGVSSEFGARFDMETDALLVAVAGSVLVVAGRLGPWMLLPGAMRYAYALAVDVGNARGEEPRSRFGRRVFVVFVISLLVALWPVKGVYGPFSAAATLLLALSFARSTYWSFAGGTGDVGLSGEREKG